MEKKRPIRTFQDLEVYKNLYKAMLLVHRDIIPKLPVSERFDLVDQIGRASKAGPALIAEGFAKRYMIRQWRKYINDAMGESNEMIHHLTVCGDLYGELISEKCGEAIEIYDISCKQLTRLGQAWKDYHDKRK